MYKAVFFSLNGESTTDFPHCETPEEVWSRISKEQPRKFYPIRCVVQEKTNLVIQAEDGYTSLGGLTTQQVASYFKNLAAV